ncbi:MAG: DUF3987 domain-containing protein [Pseudomonadota bacterium]
MTWAAWISRAAEAKGAPADYVATSLLSVAGSLIGNARWVTPWDGWSEPPILWTMLIGQPSANKSPALDVITDPLKALQKRVRQAAANEHDEWAERKEAADIALSAWKQSAQKAVKDGEDPPHKPTECDPGPEPHLPLLAVNDSTIERWAAILEAQPRGALNMRDELSGWLGNMSRYANGGSDKPFWLEAYGGRAYSVERMSRNSHVDRLTIGVLGGIQPDKLSRLLLNVDDDGMLARFMPIWPEPVPIVQPNVGPDCAYAERAFERLYGLRLTSEADGSVRPWFVPLSDNARVMLTRFRLWARGQEAEHTGLLVSFIGKLPGIAIRLALILSYLDWVEADGQPEPHEVTEVHLGRACHFVDAYLLPMAERAYAGASVSRTECAARALAKLIVNEQINAFTVRDIQRRNRSGLNEKKGIEAAISDLVQADWIAEARTPHGKAGGRPRIEYLVNPKLGRLK